MIATLIPESGVRYLGKRSKTPQKVMLAILENNLSYLVSRKRCWIPQEAMLAAFVSKTGFRYLGKQCRILRLVMLDTSGSDVS